MNETETFNYLVSMSYEKYLDIKAIYGAFNDCKYSDRNLFLAFNNKYENLLKSIVKTDLFYQSREISLFDSVEFLRVE